MSELSHRSDRDAIIAAVQRLFEAGVMSASGHANLSARVSPDLILLTTQGFVRDLQASSLALVEVSGKVVEGEVDPTNQEIIDMHTAVYRLRPEVGGIVHTHSPNLLAYAMANRPLPSRYEALRRFGQASDIPVVPWAPRGTERSVGAIVEALEADPGTKAVLLGNHGVLSFGPDPVTAAMVVVVAEEAADAELAAQALGGARSLPEGASEEIRAGMSRFAK